MSVPRLLTTIALTSAATTLVVGTLILAGPAHAESPREGACKILGQGKVDTQGAAWMTEQMAAGRTNFVSPAGYVICAY